MQAPNKKTIFFVFVIVTFTWLYYQLVNEQRLKPIPGPNTSNTTITTMVTHTEMVTTTTEKREILKIMYECDKESFGNKIIHAQSLNILAAAKRVPDAQVEIWGVGWPDFDQGATLANNIQKKFGSTNFFHYIIPCHGNKFPKEQYQEMSNAGVYLAYQLAELRRLRETSQGFEWGARVVLAPYSSEFFFPEWEPLLKQNKAILAHFPWHFDKEWVSVPPSTTRDYDVVVTGTLDADWYPLRARFSDILKILEGQGYKVHIRSKGSIHNYAGFSQSAPSQWRDYINLLSNAKIVLASSSRCGYALGKYYEAMFSGALVVSNAPLDYSPDVWDKNLALINANMTNEEIADTISWWLKNDAARIERATLGWKFAQNNWDSENFVERLRHMHEHFFSKGIHTGFYFPDDVTFPTETGSQIIKGSGNLVTLEQIQTVREQNTFKHPCPIER